MLSLAQRIGIIVFDMDDTLVDRETVYTRAQTEMLKALRSSGASRIRIPQAIPKLREIDIELINLHRGDHMYDSNELARALWLHFANKVPPRKAARQAYRESRDDTIRLGPAMAASRVHDVVLQGEIPSLFDSCRKTLNRLRKRYLLVLLASGKRRLQMTVVHHHRLEKYFDLIVVRKVKNRSVFLEVKALAIDAFRRKAGEKPRRLLAVGDRISQDIEPARKAGFETIWIPGPYFPGTTSDGKPTHRIKELAELPEILLRDGG